ncbi:CidA/LrgA family protein [Oscillochloris sp. ZM17-4]|uniref:CidA/LrgA family protein n=1 Tax=Oscillochloris sp. ZM17-4 TaxID=2866714 RepID=UPI001C7372BC|nr:CidA/LrgA family protein [Oscillochloris sp. ZM17-4]MBX0328045.1 CidA/LrgA family protein [Oscillochloris sp. ZM17-4]
MVNALLALLAFQLVGEVLVRAVGAPVPGPVVGMLLLFIAMRARGRVPEPLQRASQGLLGNLSLLFVPAGVGVIVHLQLLAADWWRLLIAIVASTLITLLVTALVMQGMIRLGRGPQ